MPRIPLSEAQPGQKLRRPAATRAGMIMVQPGTELTAAIIDRLRNLGIDSVFVEGSGRGTEKSPEEIRREIQERFRGHEHDAWMMELKEIVLKRVAGGDGSTT